jgi:hypothetical protein
MHVVLMHVVLMHVVLMHVVLMHIVLMHVVLMQGTGELAVRLIIVCESEKRCLSLLARGLRINERGFIRPLFRQYGEGP